MYGIIITIAVVAALTTGENLAKRKVLSVSKYWSAASFSLLGGLIGARIYHTLSMFPYYQASPQEAAMIHKGGLGIYGALVGGVVSLCIYLLVKRERILPWLDLGAIIIPLGQSIGRMANFANLEVFGFPTSTPWGIYIPRSFRPISYANNDIFHPLFFYESILDLALFVLLAKSYTQIRPVPRITTHQPGFYLLSYMIGYGGIRFFLDFLRINPWKIWGLNVSQAISIIFILLGAVGILMLRINLARTIRSTRHK